MVRDRTDRILQTHFQSQVQFSDFEVSLFPRVRVTISELVMRHNGRTDIPPLFQIRKVHVYANFLSLLRAKPRVALVVLEGLQIHTPPRHPGGAPLIHGTDQDLQKSIRCSSRRYARMMHLSLYCGRNRISRRASSRFILCAFAGLVLIVRLHSTHSSRMPCPRAKSMRRVTLVRGWRRNLATRLQSENISFRMRTSEL